MEINKFEDIKGVLTVQDIPEGRFVLLVPNGNADHDFGSWADLPGVRVPTTQDEARRARYILTWAVTNQKPPFYVPMPGYANVWTTRGGWGDATNLPLANTMYMTYPGYQNCVTIPSATPSLAFNGGTFTVQSGCYIWSANLVPGALVSVSFAAATAGQLQYEALFTDNAVGVVEYINPTTRDITVSLRDL